MLSRIQIEKNIDYLNDKNEIQGDMGALSRGFEYFLLEKHPLLALKDSAAEECSLEKTYIPVKRSTDIYHISKPKKSQRWFLQISFERNLYAFRYVLVHTKAIIQQ